MKAKINKYLARWVLLLGLLLPVFAPAQDGEPVWTVNFRDVDIQELIGFVAEATGKTIVIDSGVSGRVQVISTQAVSSAELYDLFLSILEVQGFTAVESNQVVRIIPTAEARFSPLPISVDGPQRQNSQVITQLIQVRNVSAVQLVPILRPLAAQEAVMAAYGPSNAIIITDTAANIERLRQTIEFMDNAAQPQAEVIPLQNARAAEVVEILQNLQGGAAAEAIGIQIAADERSNSILVSGDELQRQRIRSLLADLDSPLNQSGNVQVVYLQYAKAEELAPVLANIVRSTFSEGGDEGETRGGAANIEADPATNSLIITAEPEVIAVLRGVISRLDIRRAQVLVEAIIVEISGEDGEDLGVQWLFADDNGVYGSSSTGSQVSAGIAGAALGAAAESGDINELRAALAQALANTPGQVLGVGQVDAELSFNVLINALQASQGANILSTPSLLTLDNQEALIAVGRSIPFITGSYTSTGNASSNPDNPFQTVERQHVGLTLRVTPHINEGDSMVLELSQEVSSLLGSGDILLNGNPITNERTIETTVLTDNGRTVILGGLLEDNVTQSNQRVPLLGNIPVMGRLFRNDSVTINKTHLLVFLRATIMREDRILEAATAEKYRFIRARQLQEISRGGGLSGGASLPVLPEWETVLEQSRQAQEASGQAGDDD